MNLLRLATALVLLLAAGVAGAQPAEPTPPPDHPPGEDPIGARLFPPDLIMGHQQELGITDKQRAAIIKEIEKAQPPLLQAQWTMQEAAQQLAKLLEAAQVDEAKALAQADKVMNLERDVKRGHLGMLIRIKNLLTEAQRSRLAELRGRPRPSPGG